MGKPFPAESASGRKTGILAVFLEKKEQTMKKKVEKFKKRFILWDLLPSVESVDGGW